MENAVSTSKRVEYIDIAKGIGIICVIVAHSGLLSMNTFHMAFFFILSGYFMSAKLPMKDYAKSRARQLLIPYLFGVVLTICGDIFRNMVLGLGVNNFSIIKKWVIAGFWGLGSNYGAMWAGKPKWIGALWFLLAMFWASLLVRKFINHKYMIVILAVFAYVGMETVHIRRVPWNIQQGFIAALFMGIGLLANRWKVFEKKVDIGMLLMSLALWIYAIYYDITYGFVRGSFHFGFLNVIVACAATYVLVWLSRFLENKLTWIGKILSFYGKNSLIIFVFHAIEINVCQWGWIRTLIAMTDWKHAVGIGDLCEFFVRLAFCTVCVLIVNAIKPLRWIFGKK